MLEGKTIGFVGGGNMAEALISGIVGGGAVSASKVLVAEPNDDRAAQLQQRYGIRPVAGRELAAQCEILVIAVKPQVVDAVLDELEGQVAPGTLLVSVAAGIPSARFERSLPGVPVVRVMPNTPALVGQGMSVISPGSAATAQHVAQAGEILATTGRVVELDEASMDAVTAISGSGPAYFFYLVEALVDGAQQLGLDRETATSLVVQTATGAAAMLRQPGADAAALRTAVTSPGGTTAAAIDVLEGGGARELFARAALAARDRSAQLGRER